MRAFKQGVGCAGLQLKRSSARAGHRRSHIRAAMPRLLLLSALALLTTASASAQPDLNGQNRLFPTPDRLNPGDTFVMPYSFGNDGTQASPPTQVAFYFSTDRFLAEDAILVSRVPVEGIGVQSNAFGTATLTVPAVERGGYFVVAVIDDPDIIAEIDETDNSSSGLITVGGSVNGPDLLISTADLEDDTAAPGDRVSFEYTIANRGGTDIEDFEMGYYLGGFDRPRSQWIFVERETLGGIDAGDDDDESEQVTVPAGTPPGRYSLLIVADDGNAIEERNETNNILGAGLIQITNPVAAETNPATEALGLRASPNPAGASVEVSYSLAEARTVRLALVDLLGREVAVVEGMRASGLHTEVLGTRSLPPGVYVAQFVAGVESASVRITVAR